MAPPLVDGRKTRTLSASPDSSPGSNPRPFSFGELGRARPRPPGGARLLPPIKDPDSELELSADDIIESNDVGAFELAAADAARSSGFEVGDLGAFDEIEVEGLASAAPEPAPLPVAAVAPVSMRVDYASPQASTLIGMPSAPITSRLPVEESVIVSEPPAPERTLEMKGDALAKVAEQVAFLEGDMPEQTQVLVRSQMPASIQGPRTLPTGHTPPPTSVHTPSIALAATAAAWQSGHMPAANGHARPSSVAPVALDISRPRAAMPSIPAAANVPRIHAPAQKSGVSGLLIGGLIFAAASLIGVVGVGGYIASRSLSDKAESFATSPAPEPSSPSAAAAPAEPAAAAPADPAAASPVGVDVSALPSAPVRGASGASAPQSAAPAVAAPAPAAAPRNVGSNGGGSHASGGSSPAAPAAPTSTGRSGAPLPPPGGASTAREAPLPAATGAAVALPPPPNKPAPAAAAPVVAPTTGNVSVDPKLRAVVVDGSFRRVNDGVLTLSCGTHRIKVGMNDPQVVNVPCGGSVSL